MYPRFKEEVDDGFRVRWD